MSRRLLLLITLFIIVILINVNYMFSGDERPLIEADQPVAAFQRDRNLILMWTTWFGEHIDYNFNKCPVSNCALTYDRSLINEAQYVVFHMRDVNRRDLPAFKPPSQKWVAWILEAPIHSGKLCDHFPFVINCLLSGNRVAMKVLSDRIDYSMTYRPDSDIPAPYGRIVRRSQPLSFKHLNLSDTAFTQKTKSVAWLVSNCWTSSQRERLVSKLSQYIDVDIYGACGDRTCSLADKNYCYSFLERNYKFYLAFENSLCKDYVTEKLFNILQYNLIPVVYGMSNYSSFMPPNSYVDVQNFTSVKQLADFLHLVAGDERIHNSYFDWKRDFYSESFPAVDGLCELCKFMANRTNSHAQSRSRPSKSSFLRWFEAEPYCRKGRYFFS